MMPSPKAAAIATPERRLRPTAWVPTTNSSTIGTASLAWNQSSPPSIPDSVTGAVGKSSVIGGQHRRARGAGPRGRRRHGAGRARRRAARHTSRSVAAGARPARWAAAGAASPRDRAAPAERPAPAPSACAGTGGGDALAAGAGAEQLVGGGRRHALGRRGPLGGVAQVHVDVEVVGRRHRGEAVLGPGRRPGAICGGDPAGCMAGGLAGAAGRRRRRARGLALVDEQPIEVDIDGFALGLLDQLGDGGRILGHCAASPDGGFPVWS